MPLRKCCSFCEKFCYICGAYGFNARRRTYFLKVFFAFVLVRKCGSFQERGQRTALISCVVVWLCTILVCRYPILFKCGALYRLFSQRSFHNLLTNKRKSTPHFLFYNNRTYGVGGQYKNYVYMKQLYSILFIATALSSCIYSTDINTKQSLNEQQQEFNNMLSQGSIQRMKLGNEILVKEFDENMQLSIGEYMDSVAIFVNWKAEIDYIRSNSKTIRGKEYEVLTFYLSYDHHGTQRVNFDVDYVLPKDESNSDALYNKIKSISDNSMVYFDGFIRIEDGKPLYSYSSSSFSEGAYKLNRPDFKFHIVDINTSPKIDTLSSCLRNAISATSNLQKELTELGVLYHQRKISKREYEKRIKVVGHQQMEVIRDLTEEEQGYLKRFTRGNDVVYQWLRVQEGQSYLLLLDLLSAKKR